MIFMGDHLRQSRLSMAAIVGPGGPSMAIKSAIDGPGGPVVAGDNLRRDRSNGNVGGHICVKHSRPSGFDDAHACI